MPSAPARVLAVHTEFVVVDAAGLRCCVANRTAVELQPGDWVLVDGGSIIRRTAPPDAALDHPFEADLIDERRHYPTEDPESAPPILHHPPAGPSLA
jgi:hydrogenase maturation factor